MKIDEILSKVKNEYDNTYEKVSWYDLDKLRNERFRRIAKIIKNQIKEGAILDFGAGDGLLSNYLDDNIEYIYLDLSTKHKFKLRSKNCKIIIKI